MRIINAVRICLVICVGCFVVATGCRTSKTGYVSKGNRLFNDGKYAEAAINYRKAIQKDAKYGDAYYRLGLAAIKLNDSAEAQKSLVRAVQLLPDNVDAKEKLGGLMLEYYVIDPHHSKTYYDTAKKMSDELLQKNPNSVEGLREKAILAVGDRKPEEAAAALRKALQNKPNDPDLTTLLARVLADTGKAAEAETLLSDLNSRQKSYAPAYDLLYQIYTRLNRIAEAESLLKAKVRNNPKNADYILELATYYASANKAEMKNALQMLIDAPKDFPNGPLLVGDFYSKLRDYPEAIRYYQQDASVDQDATHKAVYQKRLVNAFEAAGKMQDASNLVEQILKANPKDEEALRVQANLLLRTGKKDNVAAAQNQLQDLAKRRPDDATVWLGLGRADELKGDLDSARKQYQEALKRQPSNLSARYALADIGLIQKRPNDTLMQTGEILKIRPNDGRARLLRAQALMRTGNPALARSELTALSHDYPKDPQPQVELGLLALSEQKYRDAEEAFTKLRATDDPRAYAGLGAVYSFEKQFDKALQVLNEGLKKSPDSELIKRQLANSAAMAGKYDLAITQLREVLTANPKSAPDSLALGDVYDLKGDSNNAIAMYRQAYALAPAELNSGLALARALAHAGRDSEATAQYRAVLKDHPDDPIVMNSMAYFLVDTGSDLDEALRLAQRAVQKAPNEPNYSDTIACIYLKKGQRDSALQIFSNLVRKYPEAATFRYHLGMALVETGDKGRARKELQTALASHPSRQDEARIKQLLGKIG
jgi:tetratricopeptide (TPR) repeat protein